VDTTAPPHHHVAAVFSSISVSLNIPVY